MVSKISNFLFVAILSSVFVIQSSTSSPLENEKLAELTERFDQMQARMEAKMEELKAEVKELKLQTYQQDEEIVHLKNKISNLESLAPSNFMLNDAVNLTSNENIGSSSRVLSRPPTSCQELKDNNGLIPMDGIHLLKNNGKIQVAFCTFPTGSNPASQEVIGNVNVKTKIVQFYVQRNTSFSTRYAVIPFELALLNEGDAMDLASGIFTAPVNGLYHFEFSGMKDITTYYLGISLQVNGDNVGAAVTNQYVTGTRDSISMTASLRLKSGDKVNVYNGRYGDGVLYDDEGHVTHFSGWLEEEDLI